MKTEVNTVCCHSLQALTAAEAAGITGGGDFKNYVKNVATLLTREGGAIRTLTLGGGLLAAIQIVGAAAGFSR